MNDPWALEHASDALRDAFAIVLTAGLQEARVLQFASQRMRDDPCPTIATMAASARFLNAPRQLRSAGPSGKLEVPDHLQL